MSYLELELIRQRANEPVLGKSISRELDQAILDRRVLIDLVDTHVAAVRGAAANYLLEMGENDRLAGKINAVRELHKPENKQRSNEPRLCAECAGYWPCRTIQTLEEYPE